MICTDHTRYGEAAARGALVRNALGQPYVYRYSTLESFVVSQFDFTTAAGRELYARLLREAIADGHDGWMEDFGEYTPLDARAADGSTGTALHDLYPTRYHCGAFAAAQRAARFVRSGWTGSRRTRRWTIEASLATLRRPFRPCAVRSGGGPPVRWRFDRRTRVLRATFTARRGRLVARSCSRVR